MACMEEYKCKFEALSNRLREFSKTYKLSCFLSGIKEEIRLPIRMFTHKTLLTAYRLAKIQEEHVLNGKRNYKNSNMNFPNSGSVKSECCYY